MLKPRRGEVIRRGRGTGRRGVGRARVPGRGGHVGGRAAVWGGSAVHDAVTQRQSEVEALLRSVPGSVANDALRAGDGSVTVMVREDRAGTRQSTRRAAAWVGGNVPASGGPPEVVEGDVQVHFAR